MKKLSILLLTVILMLSFALPVMAQSQGAPNNSPVQKNSFDNAMFYGENESTNIYVGLNTDNENPDQYILYVSKYDSLNGIDSYGHIEISKSNAVFDVKKGIVAVNASVPVNQVQWVYDEASGEYYAIEQPAGEESVNLSWSFSPRDYSYHQSVDKNIELWDGKYLQLGKYTYKQYNKVTVSGTVSGMDIAGFDSAEGNVTSGHYFEVIK